MTLIDHMNKISFVLVAATLFSHLPVQTKAQDDHLKPADGIFSQYDSEFNYYSSVRKILLKGFSDHPEVRIVIIPSFTPESALDIEQDQQTKKYILRYHLASPSIWYSKGKKKIKVDTSGKEIEYPSFLLIKKLFLSAVNNAHYPTDTLRGIVMDGTNYYYSVNDLEQRTGMTYSPKAGSKMNKLTEITNYLIVLVKSKSAFIEFDNAFSKEITDLTKQLQ
jgi:hypothetical protein